MDEKRKNLLILVVGLILTAIFGYFAIQKQVRKNLVFFWSNSYYYIIYFSLIIAFIMLFLKLSKKFKINDNIIRTFYALVFLPAALFPIFKCYFNIPYIFCRACPRKCPFGELRPFIIPSFLVLNIDKRFWCFKLCPFGTLQDYQLKLSNKRINLPRWLRNIRYVFLLFAIIVVSVLILNETFYLLFFNGNYNFIIGTFIIALIIFILAFFIPRFWCNYFCPIGCFSDLVLKLENKFK